MGSKESDPGERTSTAEEFHQDRRQDQCQNLKGQPGQTRIWRHQRYGSGERNRDSEVSASGVGGACKWLNGKCDMGGAGSAEEGKKPEKRFETAK